jgi:hypothetical protein
MVDTYQLLSSGREKPSFQGLQTLILLVLSKRLFFVSPDEIWRATGDILRLALVMGLNEDPSVLAPDMPNIDAELWRRLWYTIANLELDASLRRGMPSSLQGVKVNCAFPGDDSDELRLIPNQDDNSLRHAFTLHANISIPLRLNAISLLTAPDPDPNAIKESITMLHTARFNTESFRKAAERNLQDSHQCNGVMLELLFLQSILLLHVLTIQLPSSDLSYSISQMDCIPTCLRALGQLESLDPDQTLVESISNTIPLKLLWAYFGDDILRAAFTACYFFKSSTPRSLDAGITIPKTGAAFVGPDISGGSKQLQNTPI